MQEDSLGRSILLALVLSLVSLLPAPSLAENTPPVSLQTSETLFTVLTAINTCGYDAEIESSDPLRAQIRSEVGKAIQNAEGGKDVIAPLCEFYREHQAQDTGHDLAQYVSLALYLGAPPTFTPKVKQGELPPDANGVAGIISSLQAFYEKLGLHQIWERHRARYTELADIYHDPLSKMTFDTEIYLKLPSAGYLGRQFTVYLDAMGAPGQTNARQYAADYYVVISPSSSVTVKMQQIRHTYLHYLLDPLAMKNGGAFQKLEPLLDDVKMSPMDEAFKNNISLLVTECLIRAIEIRTPATKTSETDKLNAVNDADKEGFVLTPYFYNAVAKFEKDPVGMRNAYADMLAGIEVGKEMKRASQIQFAESSAPELLHLARPKNEHLLLNAERRLSAGDTETAQKLAQQALDEEQEDPGRALFILAQVATANSDMQGARTYFERALQTAREAKVIAWSHIYLGRIYDLQANRDAAVDHYRAALSTGGTLPEVKSAAERGLQQPYEPPSPAQPQE